MDRLKNAGKVWTKEEIEILKGEFNAGATLKQMAETHCRSGSAIISKLWDIGALIIGDGYHYYKAQTTPWAMWQEAREVDRYMKGNPDEPEST